MSVEALSAVLGETVGDGTAKLVLIELANHARRDGTAAWPGKGTLAQTCERDPKTVQRKLRYLEQHGWIRAGDQDLVAHLRADRRPVVYDVALDQQTRDQWATAHARGDTMPPREPDPETPPVDNHTGRGDILRPRPEGHGGTPQTPRGDIAVSTNPSRTTQDPPTPTGAAAPAGEHPAHSCRAHPTGRPGCRACGTTPRQLAEAAKRHTAEQARIAAQAALRDEQQRRRSAAADPAKARSSIEAAKRGIDQARRTATDRSSR